MNDHDRREAELLATLVAIHREIELAATSPYLRSKVRDAQAITVELSQNFMGPVEGARKASSTPLAQDPKDSAPAGSADASEAAGVTVLGHDDPASAASSVTVDPLSFEYRCTACGARQVGRSDHAGETCPTCGEGVLRLAVDAPAVAP